MADVLGVANSARRTSPSRSESAVLALLARTLHGGEKREIERANPIWPGIGLFPKRLSLLDLSHFGRCFGDLTTDWAVGSGQLAVGHQSLA